jgi:hypothetical protein
MKLIKYILIAAALFLLWMTEPLWRKVNTTTSPVDVHVAKQKDERSKLIAAEAKKKKDLEAKFGKKPAPRYSTGVPPAVQKHWDKTLSYPNSLEEERCGPIRPGNNGWVTVCRYRAKDSSGALQLRQNTYTIKNDTVIK